MVDFLIKAFAIFFVQSFIFQYFLHGFNEDNLLIWDLYFLTNGIAAIVTLFLGYIFKMYFPIYFTSLMFLYYIASKLYLKDKSLKNLFLYFSINIYTIFAAHLLFSLNFSIASISSTFGAVVILTILLVRRKIILGLYLIPLLYYIVALCENRVFFESLVSLFGRRISISVFTIDQLLIICLIIMIPVLEIRVNKFILFVKDKEKQEYKNILKYKNLHNNSSFKLPQVDI